MVVKGETNRIKRKLGKGNCIRKVEGGQERIKGTQDGFKISVEFSVGKYLYRSVYCTAYRTTCILLKLWKSDRECSPGGHVMFVLHLSDA